MNPKTIQDICLSLPKATFDLKIEWEAELGRVVDKIFCMLGTDNQGTPVLTLKAKPETCVDLKLNYPSWIVSGYYMNKTHWISILIESEDVDPKLVESLLRDSYEIVASSLPKYIQTELKE